MDSDPSCKHVSRYLDLIRSEMLQIGNVFSDLELGLLLHVMRKMIVTEERNSGIPVRDQITVEVSEQMRLNSLNSQFEVEAEPMRAKLSTLQPACAYAIWELADYIREHRGISIRAAIQSFV